MPWVHEPAYTGDFLLGEAKDYRSREAVTLRAGDGAEVEIKAGEVVGRKLFADPADTGDGTVTGAAFGRATVLGAYTLTCIAAAANGGTFSVVAPDGNRLADAEVGVAYANDHLAFTINDGAADFVVGDAFTITAAEGDLKVGPVDPAATDGSQRFAGVAIIRYVVPDGADEGGVLITRDANFKRLGLIWPDGIGAADKDAILAEMAAVGCIVRDSA